MSVLLVSQADITVGAARAAYRLHRALLDYGTDSRMKVRSKKSDDWTVDGPDGKLGKVSSLLRPGGIIRLVVPDLEAIARHYLQLLELADRGESGAEPIMSG